MVGGTHQRAVSNGPTKVGYFLSTRVSVGAGRPGYWKIEGGEGEGGVLIVGGLDKEERGIKGESREHERGKEGLLC